MTADYLRLLFDFHYWARDRVLDAAAPLTREMYERDLGSSFKSVRDTLVHLYSAECAWYQRWEGNAPAAHLNPDQFPDVGTLRRAWATHEANVRAFIGAVDDRGVEQVYEYRLFNGASARSPLWQMATHVVNHGSYHRGQITTMMRQLGARPPKSMDLIAYYREKAEDRASKA